MVDLQEMWWLNSWRCGDSLVGDVCGSLVGYVIAHWLDMWRLIGWLYAL